MSDNKRKRSALVKLSTLGVIAMTAGCSSQQSDEDWSQDNFGDPTEISSFTGVTECKSDTQFSEEICKQAKAQALAADAEQAPRFEDMQDCEDQFGNCTMRGSTFVPLMAGFMISRAISGSGYRYSPLYRNPYEDSYYSGSGGKIFKKAGKKFIGSKALASTGAPKIWSRSAVASRGGFGSRAGKSGGGWGG